MSVLQPSFPPLQTAANSAGVRVDQTCTVNYTFNPTHPGPRYGAIALYDNASPANVVATVYLQGAGVGPQVAFAPPVQNTIGSDLNVPYGVAVDGNDNVYVADQGNNRVLKEALSGGSYIETTIGSGLSDPEGVAVGGNGNVYIVDSHHNLCIVRIHFSRRLVHPEHQLLASGHQPYHRQHAAERDGDPHR
jgi:streptogramin lyase